MKIKPLALAFAVVLSMATMTAHAWTVTTQGTIQDGYDTTGVFGTADLDLFGLAFTQAITISTDPAKWSSNSAEDSNQWVIGSGPAFTTTVTVNGYTVTFNSLNVTDGLQHIANNVSNGSNNSADTIFSSQEGLTADGDSLQARTQVESTSIAFVPILNFDQTIFQNIDLSFFDASTHFAILSLQQDAYFYGTPDSITVNGEVPEPATTALLGLGLLGLAAARHKSAKSKSA